MQPLRRHALLGALLASGLLLGPAAAPHREGIRVDHGKVQRVDLDLPDGAPPPPDQATASAARTLATYQHELGRALAGR